MERVRQIMLRSLLVMGLTCAGLAISPTTSRAQFFGYGGYGYSPYAFGAAYPGFGYGGLPNWGYGYGFGGFGFPFGVTGYPQLATPFNAYQGVGPYGYAAYGYGYPIGAYANPYFGLGLSPLGVQSAVTERYLLGNPGYRYRAPTYVRGYGPVRSSGGNVVRSAPAAIPGAR
jgi:hypothetical protein